MTIVHLIYSAQVAGAEKYLQDLLPALQAEGFNCHLICVCPVTAKHKFVDFCEQLNKKGIDTLLLTGSKFGFLSVAKHINVYLRQVNATVLHSHLFKSDLLAVTVKKIYNKKIFLLSTKHGYEESYLTSYPVHKGKRVYNAYYLISKYLSRNTNEQYAVSKVLADMYYDLGITKNKMGYIHHGIDVPLQDSSYDITKYRLGTPQLVMVGRIEEVKGHQYLFEALPEAIRYFPELRLLVLGSGTLQEKLIALAAKLGIEKNVIFLGYRQRPSDYIAASDIMVQPSLFESFGLVYIEAFAQKIPVIAFDTAACNEIVINNETGLLVPVFDSTALAEKIIYLLENTAERKRLGLNGYNKYTSYYNTARMAKQTADWYRLVIKE